MNQKQVKVLENVGRASTMRELAKLSGVSRTTINSWLKNDEEFVAGYQDTMDTILEGVKDTVVFGVGGVLDALREAAKDQNHPHQFQMIREYMRVLEKWTGRQQTVGVGKLELEVNFME